MIDNANPRLTEMKKLADGILSDIVARRASLREFGGADFSANDMRIRDLCLDLTEEIAEILLEQTDVEDKP